MFRALTLLSLFSVTGCSDYSLGALEKAPAEGPDAPLIEAVDTGAATAWPADQEREVGAVPEALGDTNATFNAILQYTRFGAAVGRCDLEFAFYAPAEGDGLGGGSGRVIEVPNTPGTCAFTAFDPDEPSVPGAINARGTRSAGAAVTLADHATVTLAATVGAEGGLTYLLDDCRHETFPFARTFDIFAPGESGGIPAFSLEAPVAVGPDLVRVLPTDESLVADILPTSLAAPLVLEWALAHTPPETADGALTRTEVFLLRNTRRSDNAVLQAIACIPETPGRVEVPAAYMGLLTPDPGDDSTYAMAQIDVYFEAVPVLTSWGTLATIQSQVSLSGELRLEP